jgi:hypothetical protein
MKQEPAYLAFANTYISFLARKFSLSALCESDEPFVYFVIPIVLQGKNHAYYSSIFDY